MAHEWHAGVLSASSWHRLETLMAMATADDCIQAGEHSAAWPSGLEYVPLQTVDGLPVPGRRGVVGIYPYADSGLVRRVIGDVGGDFHASTPDGWRSLVRAAVAAGGRPTGAFALRGGSRVVATFEVGQQNGIRTNLALADAFDGSMKLTAGCTAIKVVCANTMAMWLGRDGTAGGTVAALRHTASLETRTAVLKDAIGEAIASGETVRATYARAQDRSLNRAEAQAAFDLLFPPAPEDASKAQKTKIDNARADAWRAAALPVNQDGPNLATLWNAATFLVDRTADGKPRPVRGGGDRLDAMMFGTRGERVRDVQTVIEVLLRDGSAIPMTASDAASAGVDLKQVGAKVLEDILS